MISTTSSKLVLESIEDDESVLFAIHASVEPYRLAFLLNKNLHIKLERNKKDLDATCKGAVGYFPLFCYHDMSEDLSYYLIANKCMRDNDALHQIDLDPSSGNLFSSQETSTTTYLIPERKRTDYFLKIYAEATEYIDQTIAHKLNAIPAIATAYLEQQDQLKSKEYLIFD
ncbi:hypothetical protein GCM10009117_17720 [Gangjinia marincola]|uniref:IPExxxVDY family protein n=1 Tax=Gangjinia marincola TaxID=578463 RepID=A0ABP3XW15_9FLAO